MNNVGQSATSADEHFEIVTVDGHHSQYVHDGALTDAPGGAGIIGMLLMVVDRDGWATLHRAEAMRYQHGKQLVSFGPRIPWPDGSIAARKADPDA
jgi:hypothetical protein